MSESIKILNALDIFKSAFLESIDENILILIPYEIQHRIIEEITILSNSQLNSGRLDYFHGCPVATNCEKVTVIFDITQREKNIKIFY